MYAQVSISYLWNRLHRSDNALLEYGFFQQVLESVSGCRMLFTTTNFGVAIQAHVAFAESQLWF